MTEFRGADLISIHDFIYILILTVMLLAVVYLVLKKLRPFLLANANRKALRRIEVRDSHNIPGLGKVAIVSVDQENFLIVQASTGVGIAAMRGDQLLSENTKPDVGI